MKSTASRRSSRSCLSMPLQASRHAAVSIKKVPSAAGPEGASIHKTILSRPPRRFLSRRRTRSAYQPMHDSSSMGSTESPSESQTSSLTSTSAKVAHQTAPAPHHRKNNLSFQTTTTTSLSSSQSLMPVDVDSFIDEYHPEPEHVANSPSASHPITTSTNKSPEPASIPANVPRRSTVQSSLISCTSVGASSSPVAMDDFYHVIKDDSPFDKSSSNSQDRLVLDPEFLLSKYLCCMPKTSATTDIPQESEQLVDDNDGQPSDIEDSGPVDVDDYYIAMDHSFSGFTNKTSPILMSEPWSDEDDDQDDFDRGLVGYERGFEPRVEREAIFPSPEEGLYPRQPSSPSRKTRGGRCSSRSHLAEC